MVTLVILVTGEAQLQCVAGGLEQSRPCVIQIGHQPSIAHYSSGVGMMPINIHLSPAAPVDGHYRCTNDAQGNTQLSTSPQ